MQPQQQNIESREEIKSTRNSKMECYHQLMPHDVITERNTSVWRMRNLSSHVHLKIYILETKSRRTKNGVTVKLEKHIKDKSWKRNLKCVGTSRRTNRTKDR